MLSSLILAVVSSLLVPATLGQDDRYYTLWSSVVFSRAGERTPSYLGSLPVELTTLGANQSYNAGSFLRERYLTSYGSSNGLDSAPIQGLSPNRLDSTQLYVQSVDLQFTIGSAQAFMQGLYPPYQIDDSSNITDTDATLDPSAFVNDAYLEAPLGGYQYPQIQTADGYSPEFVYLAGMLDCPAFDAAVLNYLYSEEAIAIAVASKPFYVEVGSSLLADVLPYEETWDYHFAYTIYDYVNYQATHNASFAALLEDTSYLDQLRWYADQQQYGWLGNYYAINNLTDEDFPGPTGSISTIAGNFLASKMLGQLQSAIEYQGEYYKLNLLFGDFQPLLSLFALVGIPNLNTDFYGLPDYGSVAVFELYSISDGSDVPEFPSEDDLWVNFYFRNGTDPDAEYRAYPLFNQGPDKTDMSWEEFQIRMIDILAGDVGDWCSQCGALNLFCAYWNGSASLTAYELNDSSGHRGLGPILSGVVGAIVALVLAGIIFGAIMLIAGVRFHRNHSKKSELGGFKGSQKMASDKDLIIPKGGAVVGATVEQPESPRGGHERVGSWELKQNEANYPNIAVPVAARRPSFEDDEDIGAAPYRVPTKPDERV